MQDKLRDLIVRHCDTLRSEADTIARAMARSGPGMSADRHVILAAAHRLKGSSGSIGFMQISAEAQRLEIMLREAGDRPLSASEIEEIGQIYKALQDRIDRVEPSQSELFRKLAEGNTVL